MEKIKLNKKYYATIKKTNPSFIQKDGGIHFEDGKILYEDGTVTLDYDIPIEIGCPIHGSFFETPKKHLAGYGCPKCGDIPFK